MHRTAMEHDGRSNAVEIAVLDALVETSGPASVGAPKAKLSICHDTGRYSRTDSSSIKVRGLLRSRRRPRCSPIDHPPSVVVEQRWWSICTSTPQDRTPPTTQTLTPTSLLLNTCKHPPVLLGHWTRHRAPAAMSTNLLPRRAWPRRLSNRERMQHLGQGP